MILSKMFQALIGLVFPRFLATAGSINRALIFPELRKAFIAATSAATLVAGGMIFFQSLAASSHLVFDHSLVAALATWIFSYLAAQVALYATDESHPPMPPAPLPPGPDAPDGLPTSPDRPGLLGRLLRPFRRQTVKPVQAASFAEVVAMQAEIAGRPPDRVVTTSQVAQGLNSVASLARSQSVLVVHQPEPLPCPFPEPPARLGVFVGICDRSKYVPEVLARRIAQEHPGTVTLLQPVPASFFEAMETQPKPSEPFVPAPVA